MKKNNNKKTKSRLTTAILFAFKTNPQDEFGVKQLCSLLNIKDSYLRTLTEEILKELAGQQQLVVVGNGKYTFNSSPSLLEGIIEFTAGGRAFVMIADLQEEFVIKQGRTKNALNGDKVSVRKIKTNNSGRTEAEVVEVIERSKTEFVGSIQIKKNYAFFVADNKKIHVDFYVERAKTLGAKDGQKVIVRLVEWPKRTDNPIGEVIEVLGNAGENDTEIHAILAEFGLPYKFPDKVHQEAESISKVLSKEEINKRKDLRGTTTFTIDPYDAKDFDDALSIKKIDESTYEIGVHIADVSYYVKPQTHLDKESYSRGNSVYLVDRVVPMLPEALSNELCSLRPNEDKFTFSAIFRMNTKAEILNVWLGKTVINSDKRFSYEEAQEILKKGEGIFCEEIALLDKFAKIHRKHRLNNGALNIESSEVKFRLDEKGNPIDVFEKVMQDTNQLIEEFMLLANKAVAEFVGKPAKNKITWPFVYRIHDQPSEEKIEDLKKYLSRFGYTIKPEKNKPISFSLNNVMEEAKKKNDLHIIAPMCIKSMAKAVYSPQNIGHYGLAFDYYTHFTSPIRRYADLIVHRILEQKLEGGKNPNFKLEILDAVCKHISGMEKLAVDAERASIKFMQVKYLSDRIGEVFDGKISGVTEWGIFVELNQNKCEGLIRLNNLTDDYYYFDSDKLLIKGQRKGKTFGLGDSIMIKVKNVDLIRKQIDFELASKS
ncbi:MAG: ribonuclease R [Bacteroidia bacterium]